MNLSNLPKITERSAKRVGRGMGSGKGSHTTGRGQKGQKSRGKVKLIFEGTKVKKSFIKRLPMLRGKNKFKAWGDRPVVISLEHLEKWPENKEVNIENLIKEGIVDAAYKNTRVKILGNGEVKKALVIAVSVTAGAKEKITAAGGKIIKA